MGIRTASVLCLVLVLAAPAVGEEDFTAIAEAVRPSLVKVEYTLRYDVGEAPRAISIGSSGFRRAFIPGITGLEGLVKDERPLEVTGLLVGPRQVFTVDPMIHPRFVERIDVRLGNARIQATPERWLREGGGMILELLDPLPGGCPLVFDAARPGPYYLVGYQNLWDEWSVSVHPTPKGITIPEHGPAATGGGLTPGDGGLGLVVNGKGEAVGLSSSGLLELDGSWRGSPLDRPAFPAEKLAIELDDRTKIAATTLVRVRLDLRSPPQKEQDRLSFRSRVEGEASTRLDVVGVVLPGGRLLVLAGLNPKITARLEKIRAYPHVGNPVTASFEYSLRYYQGFVARLAQPMPGEAVLARQGAFAYRRKLLIAVEVLIQGDKRISRVCPAGFFRVNVGWRRRVGPALGSDPGKVFLFDLDGHLVALPLARRDLFSEQSSWRRTFSDRALLAAPDLRMTLDDRDEHADTSNVPLSEADENRLAWLGVVLQPLGQELARANEVSELTHDGKTGALISFVYPDSPAAEAGLKTGDILLRLHAEGHPQPLEVVGSPHRSELMDLIDLPRELRDRLESTRGGTPWPSAENSFTRMLTDLGIGTRYTAEVFRDGAVHREEFTVVRGPTHYDSASRFKSEPLGLTVRDLTYEVRRHFQLEKDAPGVIVSKVEPGGKSAVAGVRPFVVVTHVDGAPLGSAEEFEEGMKAEGERQLTLRFRERTWVVKIKVDPTDK